MKLEQFANNLIRIKPTPDKAILFLGFDATQSILHHSPIRALIEEIMDGQVSNPNIKRDKLRNRWLELHSFQRREIIIKHTRPDVAHVNVKAIQSITRMLNEGYINAILATDPSQSLFTYLNRGCPGIQRFDCVQNRISLFNNFRERIKDTESLFFDGADLLLGLNPSFAGLERPEYGEMLDILKKVISSQYQCLICFGWNSHYNLRIDFLWNPRDDYNFYQVGDYSSEEVFWHPTFTRTETVNDPKSRNFVTGDILVEIDEKLPGYSEDKGQAALSGKSIVFPSFEAGIFLKDRCLLWEEKTWMHRADEALKKNISIIGVEGANTRNRFARKVLSHLKKLGKEVSLIQYAKFPDLSSYLNLTKHTENFCLGVEFCDHTGSEASRGSRIQFAAMLNRLALELKDSDYILILFVPVEISEFVIKNGNIDRKYMSTNSLFAHHCLNKINVTRCILEFIDDFLSTAVSSGDVNTAEAVKPMVEEIITMTSRSGISNGDYLDRLHQFMDVWLQSALRELQKQDNIDQAALQAAFKRQFEKMWEDFSKLDDEVDFEIVVKLLAEKPSDEPNGDFELGDIKPKEKPEED
jgi:hypothetical protein